MQAIEKETLVRLTGNHQELFEQLMLLAAGLVDETKDEFDLAEDFRLWAAETYLQDLIEDRPEGLAKLLAIGQLRSDLEQIRLVIQAIVSKRKGERRRT